MSQCTVYEAAMAQPVPHTAPVPTHLSTSQTFQDPVVLFLVAQLLQLVTCYSTKAILCRLGLPYAADQRQPLGCNKPHSPCHRVFRGIYVCMYVGMYVDREAGYTMGCILYINSTYVRTYVYYATYVRTYVYST